MDPLSEAFGSVRISEARTTRLVVTAPWGFRSRDSHDAAVNFIVVLRGGGLIKSKLGMTAYSERDVLMMFDDVPYSLMDRAGSRIAPCAEVERRRRDNLIEFGGGGARTSFIIGSFSVEALDSRPVLSSLPRFLHLRSEDERCTAFKSLLELFAEETARPDLGSDALLGRLCEMLFIHTMRACARHGDPSRVGWLAALGEPRLVRAMTAMHESPGRPWSVASLAHVAGMSRSGFAALFKAVVGRGALTYLTELRMHKAGAMLRRKIPLTDVASHVGYDSESAFKRTFKRTLGMSPGEFRKKGATLERVAAPSSATASS